MVIAKLVTPSTVKYDGLKDFAPISLPDRQDLTEFRSRA